MPTQIHRSFAGGEVSPAIYARADTDKYQTGLKICRNTQVMRHGGVQNRPGTRFVCEVKDSSKPHRLIPFVFSTSESFVIELGDFYARIIRNGKQGQEASKIIEDITQANPAVFTITGHGYIDGDEVFVNGAQGPDDLNNRTFIVASAATDTFSLKYLDGSDVDTSSMPVYVASTASASKIYTIESPYSAEQVSGTEVHVKYAQSGDIVELVHPDLPPYQLKRLGDLNWVIEQSVFLPTTPRPTGLTAVPGVVGTTKQSYKVTGISKSGKVESLPAIQTGKSITDIADGNPATLTVLGHGYSDGDEVLITGVTITGFDWINDKVFVVINSTTDTFQLQDTDSTSYPAWVYVGGGDSYKTSVDILSNGNGTLIAPNIISWITDTNILRYFVYRSENGQFAFLGEAVGNSYRDIGAGINGAKTPPVYANPFSLPGDYPSVVAYHGQRLVFAATDNEPQTVWESRVSNYHNFSISSPVQDDDSVQYTLAGQRVAKIKNFIEAGTFFAMTNGAEFNVEGEGGGSITPFAINVKRQTSHGSSTLLPINVDKTVVFCQAMGAKIRDLNFQWETQGYQGNDLSIYANHLFEGHNIVSWAYQSEPNSIIWAVRNDGIMLGLTYLREQQIWGWHRHDTDGIIEDVVSVPENTTDAVYLLVKREIDGRTVRYIERMAERFFTDVKEAVFMDCELAYDGRNYSRQGDRLDGITLYASDGWTYQDKISAVGWDRFVPEDVGNQIFIDSGGVQIRFTITEYVSSLEVKGFPNKTVPADMREVEFTASQLQFAVDEISGLWHLEGKKVSIFADGFVAASPYNPSYVVRTVQNGKVSLTDSTECYSYVHIGLPYDSDIFTMDMEPAQGQSRVDKGKIISQVTLVMENSRGMWAWDRIPTDTAVSHVVGMNELKIRKNEPMDDPVRLLTGNAEVIIQASWNKTGNVFVRQVDPVPFSVLAIAPNGLI